MALDFSKTVTAASLALASLFSHTVQAAEPAQAQQSTSVSSEPSPRQQSSTPSTYTMNLPRNIPQAPVTPSRDFVTATDQNGNDVQVDVTACRTVSGQGTGLMGMSITQSRSSLNQTCVTRAIEAAGAKPQL